MIPISARSSGGLSDEVTAGQRSKAGSRAKAARAVAVVVIAAGLVTGFKVGEARAATGGYPDAGMPCEHGAFSSSGPCANYDWGPVRNGSEASTYSARGYGYRNCTDFVAWRLQQMGIPAAKTRGLGNGGQWADNAHRNGLSVSTVPQAGDAAVRVGNPGHVVFVESVSGPNMTVSQYNAAGTGTYSIQTGTPSALRFQKFVHFTDSPATSQPVQAPQPPIQAAPQPPVYVAAPQPPVQPVSNPTPVQPAPRPQPVQPVDHPQPTQAPPQSPPTPAPSQPQPTQAPPQSPPNQPAPQPGPSQSPAPAGPQTYAETTGGGVHTWTNYSNAGGTEGPTIGSNVTVQISCRLQGFRVADGDTWWYRIASPGWDNNFYSSADPYYNNGQTSGSLHGTPYYDPAVPVC